jgi:hypothetical protein
MTCGGGDSGVRGLLLFPSVLGSAGIVVGDLVDGRPSDRVLVRVLRVRPSSDGEWTYLEVEDVDFVPSLSAPAVNKQAGRHSPLAKESTDMLPPRPRFTISFDRQPGDLSWSFDQEVIKGFHVDGVAAVRNQQLRAAVGTDGVNNFVYSFDFVIELRAYFSLRDLFKAFMKKEILLFSRPFTLPIPAPFIGGVPVPGVASVKLLVALYPIVLGQEDLNLGFSTAYIQHVRLALNAGAPDATSPSTDGWQGFKPMDNPTIPDEIGFGMTIEPYFQIQWPYSYMFIRELQQKLGVAVVGAGLNARVETGFFDRFSKWIVPGWVDKATEYVFEKVMAFASVVDGLVDLQATVKLNLPFTAKPFAWECLKKDVEKHVLWTIEDRFDGVSLSATLARIKFSKTLWPSKGRLTPWTGCWPGSCYCRVSDRTRIGMAMACARLRMRMRSRSVCALHLPTHALRTASCEQLTDTLHCASVRRETLELRSEGQAPLRTHYRAFQCAARLRVSVRLHRRRAEGRRLPRMDGRVPKGFGAVQVHQVQVCGRLPGREESRWQL